MDDDKLLLTRVFLFDLCWSRNEDLPSQPLSRVLLTRKAPVKLGLLYWLPVGGVIFRFVIVPTLSASSLSKSESEGYF